MTGHQIRNYATILIALVVLVLILERPFGKHEPKTEQLLIYPDFSAESVERIAVASPTDTVEILRRGPDDWVIARDFPLPADTSIINRALEAVGDLSRANQVSRNPDKHGIYEVGDDKGASVTLYGQDDAVMAGFVLGKNASTGGTYFRRAGGEDVYVTTKPVKSYFVKREEGWQNRRIFNENADEFSRLVIEHGDSTIVFQADTEGEWQLEQPEEFPVKKDEVDRMLRGTARLFASAMPDSVVGDEITGLDSPTLTVRAERLDGSGIGLLVGKQDAAGLYYAKAADRDWIYQISKYRIDPFYKDPLEMKAPPPAPPAPADTTGATGAGGAGGAAMDGAAGAGGAAAAGGDEG